MRYLISISNPFFLYFSVIGLGCQKVLFANVSRQYAQNKKTHAPMYKNREENSDMENKNGVNTRS